MSMMIHEYHCSVCEGSFGTRKEWLSHLLEPNHQSKARKEITRWDQSERECVLIAFTTFPIASLDLLLFFSKGSTDLVTDFVWFANQPEMGFIQFESKYKVEEILSSLDGPEVRIDNQLVQLKRAGECLALEWKLLTKTTASALDEGFESVSSSEAQNTTSPPVPDVIPSSFNNADVEEASNDAHQIQNSAQQAKQKGKKEAKPSRLLTDHYHSICRAIEIPDDEYQTALEFVEVLQNLLAKKFPSCKLIWFRNWFLKLKNSTDDNELVLFFDQQGMTGKYSTIRKDWIDKCARVNRQIRSVFLSTTEAKRLGIVEKRREKKFYGLLDKDVPLNFQCRENGLTFTVLPQHTPIPEVQACRLLSYMCSYDPRIKSLLTVIRYWARVNGIAFASREVDIVGNPPDPAAMDWLVMFFLNTKMKMLPSTRKIARCGNKKLSYNGVDIGFKENPKSVSAFFSRYGKINEETHAFNVFNLVKNFFNFCTTELALSNGNLVLNTTSGQIIPIEMFDNEIKDIKNTKLEGKLQKEMVKKKLRLVQPPPSLVLLHPLYLSYGFSLCDKTFVTSVCPAMQITASKLKKALNRYKRGQKFDIMSAMKVE